MQVFDLPLGGYYRSGSNPFDMAVFLKLYHDGYWIYLDCRDWSFNFLDYLQSLGVTEIKERFLLGHCVRCDDPLCQTGRWRRKESCLELTSWDEQRGPFSWDSIEVAGPKELYRSSTDSLLQYIPEAL